MAGFRHVLAHVYTKLDQNTVYDTLHHDLKDIKEFLKTMATKLKEKKIDTSEI